MFEMESPAFDASKLIPRAFTGEGDDTSPPLRWMDPPNGTKEFALLCEDPDAPRIEPWVHWIAYKIPAETRELPQGLPKKMKTDSPIRILQGRNSFDQHGYGGPMPPRNHGPHRYFFRLFALDSELPEAPGIGKSEFIELIKGHVLAETQLVGTYERH